MTRVALPSGVVGVTQLAQTGEGPARDLVIIHGLGATSGFWYPSAVRWFHHFGRVTLFDLPGHGESDMPSTGYSPGRMANVLAELLDHLQISHAHILAHSYGGTVALSFASAHRDRVKSLVLADPRLWAVEPPSAADASGPEFSGCVRRGSSSPICALTSAFNC